MYKLLLILIPVIFFISCDFPIYRTADSVEISLNDLNDGLVVHYRMNENGDDSSGNAFHATNVNATLTEDRFGFENMAYSFNGTNQFIDMPDESMLKPSLPITVSFWVKFSSLDVEKSVIFTTDFVDNVYSGVFSSLSSSGKFSISYGDGGAPSGANRRTRYSTDDIDSNKWYFVVSIIRGQIDFDVYINEFGSANLNNMYTCCPDNNGTYSGTGGDLYYTSNPGSIGRNDANGSLPSYYFYGVVDEFRLWSRELTEEEVYTLCKYEHHIDGNFYN